MPYTIEQRGDDWCVYKLVAGDASGDPLGCHPTREDAEAQRAAIIANEEQAKTVVYFGGAAKALGDGRVGGFLVQFGDETAPDLEGEYFDHRTDFDVPFDAGPVKTAVYYHHGLDRVLGPRVIGRGDMQRKDAGVWVEAQLEMRDEYERAIYAMVEAGKLGWSSGTAPHLTARERGEKATHITRWPLGLDASLTPAPAEWRNQAIPLKSLTPGTLLPVVDESITDGTDNLPEAQPRAADVGRETAPVIVSEQASQEVETMTDKTQNDAPPVEQEETPEVKALQDQMQAQGDHLKQLGETIEQVLQMMQDSPALQRAGYTTNDGGTADPSHKSFGDFLQAVRRGDDRRLAQVYGTKTLEEDGGGTGGYLVPTTYHQELIAAQKEQSPIVSAVQRVPVNSRAGEYPALDQFQAPTAGVGNTAFAGTMTAAARAESGAYDETEPQFVMLEYNVHSVAGLTYVSKELNADSPMAVEQLLRMVIAIAINAKEEFYILRGTGVGEPLGILNSNAAIGIAPDTDNLFAWADALEMKSRHRVKSMPGRTMWLIHPGIWPDIGIMESSAGGGVFQANYQGQLGQTLLGYPIVESEHLPQDDNSGCVILADLASYVLFVRGGLEIAFSEHAAFGTGRVAWRFDERLDGMSWLKNVITLGDPQGSFTQSPFVYLND